MQHVDMPLGGDVDSWGIFRQAEEVILSQGEDAVTVQEHSEAVPRMNTDLTAWRNPMCVELVANVGLHTKPGWTTVRI